MKIHDGLEVELLQFLACRCQSCWTFTFQHTLHVKREYFMHQKNNLTSWSRVLTEKLTVPQLIKKLPAFYGTRRFIFLPSFLSFFFFFFLSLSLLYFTLIWLIVHLSIFISVINQLVAQNFCFTISLFHASTCFEHMCSSSGGQNCITQPLVSSH